MIEIKDRQIFSADGKFVHRIGTDSYFKRSTTLATDTADLFEEVDKIPPYTKAEYDAKVAELVRERYTESEEFAIQRKAITATLAPSTLSVEEENTLQEFADYNKYVEECKIKAKEPTLYETKTE